MTYTADPEPLVFNASMETENASIEEQYFDNIFRHTDAALNKTPGGNEILKLTAANNVGSNIILSVMPGDEIDLDVWCAYQAGSDYNTTYGLAAMINAVAGAFGGAAGAGGEAEAIYDAINEGLTALGLGGTQGSYQPAAYLNYLVFDKNLNYLFGGYTETVDNNQSVMQLFSLPGIDITEPGYIYVYLSNESSNTSKLILFDEMNVSLTRPIIQANDYYPFGMAMAENSYENVLETKNLYKYNGIEEQDDFGLNTYAYEFRMYDPIIGRWWQPDPVIKENMSPYAWVTNNPIRYFDVLGLDSAQRADAVAKAQEYVDQGGSWEYGAKGEPGENVDCSGLVSSSIVAGGEDNPENSGTGTGVERIVQSGTVIDDNNDAEVGNAITFNIDGVTNAHVGLITGINTNDNGNVESFTFIHSGSSTGPTTATANTNGQGYWGSRLNSVVKWDTIKNMYQGNPMQTVEVKGAGSSRMQPIAPKIVKPNP